MADRIITFRPDTVAKPWIDRVSINNHITYAENLT